MNKMYAPPQMFRQENDGSPLLRAVMAQMARQNSQPIRSPLQGAMKLGEAFLLKQGMDKETARQKTEKSAANAALVKALNTEQWRPPEGEIVTDEEGYEFTPKQQPQRAKAPAGGFEGALYALSQLTNNQTAQDLAVQLSVTQAQRRQALRDKAAAAKAQLANQISLARFKAGLKTPKKFEPVYDDNGNLVGQRDSVTGEVKLHPQASKQWIPVPGLGAFNTRTQKVVGPYGNEQPGQGADKKTLPVPPPAGAPVLSPKAREDIAKAEFAAANAELRKERETLPELKRVSDMAERFAQLMKVQDTGGLFRQLPFAKTFEGAIDPEIREMGSIVDRITPLMRQGLPGAASERDTAMFRNSAFGTDKDPQTNRNIVAAFQTSAANARDRLTFREAYLTQNGTLRGAVMAWGKYIEANPIFDPTSKPETPVLNAKRKSWKEYFGGKTDYKSRYGLE